MDSNASFYDLSPEAVLDALVAVGLYGDGRLLTLNSYENRVYQVGMDDGPPLVVKFYRPARWSDQQIQEEHEFARQLVEAEIPVIAPWQGPDGVTLHHVQGFRFAVFPCQGGRAPETGRPEVLEWIGRFIGRLHAVGAAASFQHRPALTPQTFGLDSIAWLQQHGQLPADAEQVYFDAAAEAMQQVEACYAKLPASRTLRLHGDCHLGNILWTDRGPHFVDLDDARTGLALQDCWMLLSGSRQDMSQQLGDFMAGYESFMEFDMRELHVLEALRTLRLIHYATWLTQRRADPAFIAAFQGAGTSRYWLERANELREQTNAMQQSPLWGG